MWDFFEANGDNEARCTFCNLSIKTETGNTSGLVSHIRSTHPDQYNELNKDEEVQVAVRNSPVWQFYEELGSNRVKCMKCNVILKYYYGTTSGLLRHLRRSHLEAYESIKTDENPASETPVASHEVDNETIWKFFQRNSGELAHFYLEFTVIVWL